VANLKVSVIIPAYKAARHIGEAIRSVFGQTLTDWEIVICEDGVFDETVAVVGRLAAPNGQRIELICHPTNLGVSAARNHAMQVARGKYFAFLDADDIWENDHLECLIASIQGRPAAAAYSLLKQVNENGQAMGAPTQVPSVIPIDFAGGLYESNFIQTASVMMLERSWFDRGVRFDESLNYAEDVDLCLQVLAQGGRFTCTERVTCRYRKHSRSAMAQTARMLEHMGAFYQKHLGNPLIPVRLRNERLFASRYWLGRMIWRTNPAGALAAFRGCRQIKPLQPQPYFWSAVAWLNTSTRKATA
jgi:GT2 family glycosyltransferase